MESTTDRTIGLIELAWSDKREAIQRLLNGDCMINDDAIYNYALLIQNRSSNAGGKLPVVKIFSTNFFDLWARYSNLDAATLKRRVGAKRFVPHQFDKVVFPIHRNGNHWGVLCVNVRDTRIEYYDSLAYQLPHQEINIVNQFFQLFNKSLDSFTVVNVHYPKPQQNNGIDCGVYLLKYCDFVSIDYDTQYISQDVIPVFRRQIAYELLVEELLPRNTGPPYVPPSIVFEDIPRQVIEPLTEQLGIQAQRKRRKRVSDIIDLT